MLPHDILRHAVEALERLDIPYMVVGSYASMAYGEYRGTQDVDIVAEFTRENIPDLLKSFPANEFYFSESALRGLIVDGVPCNVIHPATAFKIDFMIPRGNAWKLQQLARRRPMPLLDDRDVMTAAPEDVIIGKMWFYSEGESDKHLRDIAAILKNSRSLIDFAYIDR